MTLLRKKTSEVMDHGRAKRGKWKVEPDAAHYKNYRWWLEHGGVAPVTENFCHYWRVVAVWVPLQKLKLRLDTDAGRRFIWTLVGLIVVGIAILASILFTSVVVGLVATAALIFYVRYSFKTSFFVYEKLTKDTSAPWGWKWLEGKHWSVIALCVVLSLPMLIVVGVVLGVVFALLEIFDERELHRWFIDTTIKGIWWLTPLTILGAGAAFYLVSTAWLLPVPEGLAQVSRDLLKVLGTILAGAAVIFTAAAALVGIDELKKRRRDSAIERQNAANRQRNDALLHSIFEILHPEDAHDESRYSEWLDEFIAKSTFWDRDQMYDATPFWILESLPEEWLPTIYEHFGLNDLIEVHDRYYPQDPMAPQPYVPAKPRKRPVSGAMKTATDFIRLIWAYMVTKKWRICPVVELPE